ncbi:hypothetical protein MJO29_013921 [Puccinia striiformis f. sp. tritici]|nr:hypothetical protein MJO29_013921 [Puccinia striiformis f. sp. tritici]POW04710.1 hypothetical protein PSTT_10204 [Puccinia striiformis]POW13293.1 hypothetical protein PSHT_07828 [Puccinia striiformis]
MGQHYRGIAIYTSSSEAYATEIARQIAMRYKEAYPDSKYIPFDKILSCGLMAIAPLLRFLSSVDSVSDSLHKLKNVWYNVGLVNVVPSTIGVTC